MKSIALDLPEPDAKALDLLVERKLYPSRNEAIRAAVRDLLRFHLREDELKRLPVAKEYGRNQKMSKTKILWQCNCPKLWQLEPIYPTKAITKNPNRAFCKNCGKDFPNQAERDKLSGRQ